MLTVFNNICIIPDIHGRTFWKNIDFSRYEHVVFLGDYLDPYPFEMEGSKHGLMMKEKPITIESTINNFKEIIEFKKSNLNKVTLLLGNHDLHYFNDLYGFEVYKCRCITSHYDDIKQIFSENRNLFQFVKEINVNGTLTLFSHAGITRDYWKWIESQAELFNEENSSWDDVDVTPLEHLFNDVCTKYNLQKYIWRISAERGGRDKFGSIVWADLCEHQENCWDNGTDMEFNKSLTLDYQIFGHTLGSPDIDKPELTRNYAMLDCRYAHEFDGRNLVSIN